MKLRRMKQYKTITVTGYDWVNHMTLKPGKKIKINIKDITYVRKSDSFDLWRILRGNKEVIYVKEKYAKKLVGYKHFRVMRDAFTKLRK